MNGNGAATAGFTAAGDGARWSCSGPLTFANAGDVFAAAIALPLPTGGIVELDRLGAVDSAAVAVLLGLKRRAMKEGKPLRMTGLPPPLVALATVYGVNLLLVDDPSR